MQRQSETRAHLLDSLLVGEGYEAKASRPLVVVVIHDNSILDLAKQLEVAAKRLFVYAGRQTTHKDLLGPSGRARPGRLDRLLQLGHRLLGLHLCVT